MPLTPPWPVDVLDKLRTALEILQHQLELDPRNSVIPGAIADIEAAIVKIEPLANNPEA